MDFGLGQPDLGEGTSEKAKKGVRHTKLRLVWHACTYVPNTSFMMYLSSTVGVFFSEAAAELAAAAGPPAASLDFAPEGLFLPKSGMVDRAACTLPYTLVKL